MRSCVRFSFLALLIGVMVAVTAPAAQAAFGVGTFVAVNCDVGHESCAGSEVELAPTLKYSFPKEPTLEETKNEGFSQAGGHVPFGITDFKVNTVGAFPNEAPSGGVVTHIRTDVAAGLATSPADVAQCSKSEFNGKEGELAGTHFYQAPECKAESEIGVNKVTVYAGPNGVAPGVSDLPLEGKVYNLVQPEPPAVARASEFGVALKLPKTLTEKILSESPYKGSPFEKLQYYAHTLIEGNVEWGKEEAGTNQGDYHDYFEIEVSPTLPLLTSRLVFKGRSGVGDFITNGTSCPGNNTTRLSLTNEKHETDTKSYTTLIGLQGCGLVPFEPTFSLAPATTVHDEPTGLNAEAGLTRHKGATEIDSAQLKSAAIKLPEGLTLNPSAAAGLASCTVAQARIHSSTPGTECPAASELGTVELEVPTLPEKPAPAPLTGKIYLGGPTDGSATITGPPYIFYLDAESARYGVSVRIKGEAIPNEATGQLTTIFSENPEQPFTNVRMHFKEGALAPVANSLTCGAATTEASFFPFTETAAKTLTSSFNVTGCPSTLPFALAQSTQNQSGNGGGHTSFTFNLTRKDGEQYLAQVKTTLPPGLVGAISAVTPCTEAQAVANTCPATSQIGSATAIAGAGPTPFTFGNGVVYLTEKYKGAPYGLAVVVPAVAGPFNLGPVTTRATLTVDPYTDQVTTTSNLVTIVKGVPVRLRGISIAINKQGFLFNPTNCSALATQSTLTSTFGATQNVSTPFQVANCNLLKFKPAFKATTSAKTSKANGASLETTINYVAGQANLKAVKVQLPIALPSRLTTLQKACSEAQFAADPFKCPSGSFVGGARANTPLLPSKLTGPAILVSHGGASFPDLDLVLEANGVRTIVVGNTDIKKGITTTNFASTPDVPVSSVTVNLPVGSHSALTANTNLCARPLVMPTTLTGQNGVVVKQNTKIAVKGCGVRIVGHRVVGNTAYLTVQTFEAGRVSGKGAGVATRFRKLARAQKAATLKIPLSRRARGKHRPFKVRLRVGFVPKAKGKSGSAASVTVSFR
jgi:hypothetical protein